MLLFLFSGAVLFRDPIVDYTDEGKQRIRIFVLSHTWNAFSCLRALRHVAHIRQQNSLKFPTENTSQEVSDRSGYRQQYFYHCLEKERSLHNACRNHRCFPGRKESCSGYDLIVFQSPDIAQKLEFTLNWFLCKCRNDIGSCNH